MCSELNIQGAPSERLVVVVLFTMNLTSIYYSINKSSQSLGSLGSRNRPILFTAILQHRQCLTQSTRSVRDPEFMIVHSNDKTTK